MCVTMPVHPLWIILIVISFVYCDDVPPAATVEQRPPSQVIVSACTGMTSEVTWRSESSPDAGAKFLVQFALADQPERWYNASDTPVQGNVTTVALQPWGDYTFRVVAAGSGLASGASTTTCQTLPERPRVFPDNIRSLTHRRGRLIVTWDPVPRLYHNGPGFGYRVKLRRVGDTRWQTYTVDGNSNSYELYETFLYEVYVPYEFKVACRNSLGSGPTSPKVQGHSGEAEPLDAPNEFRLNPSLPVEAHTAHFMWRAVDTSAGRIQGDFKGYMIRYRTAAGGEQVWHEVDVQLSEAELNSSLVTAAVHGLPAFSDLRAHVVSRNTHFAGPPSRTLSFKTPEAAPGAVSNFTGTVLGPSSVNLTWLTPEQPNGILLGYNITYGPSLWLNINDSTVLRMAVSSLAPNTTYGFSIVARTAAGPGKRAFVEVTTEEEGYGLEPGFDVPVINVTVQEGDTAVLPCFVNHLGRNKLIWTDQWSTLLTFEDRRIIDDPRISIQRPYKRDWNLHIRNVLYRDGGEYSCQLNTDPVKTKIVRLIVLATTTPATTTAATTDATTEEYGLEPGFDVPVINVTVQEGDTAVLPCFVNHLGRSSMVWTDPRWTVLTVGDWSFIDDPRISIERPFNRDWNLHIRNVRYSDRGEYTCQIKTKPVKTKTVRLIVLATTTPATTTAATTEATTEGYGLEPGFDVPVINVTVQEGDTAVLPCFVNHLGRNRLVWTDPRWTVLTMGDWSFIDDPRISIERPFNRDWNLHIRNVRYSDRGEYTCQIKTKPVKTKTVRLIVLATTTPATTTAATTEATTEGYGLEPGFDVPVINVTVQEGDTAVLPCFVNHLGRNRLVWTDPRWTVLTMGDWSFIDDPRISIERPFNRDWNLHIRNVRYSDRGEYTCQIKTKPVKTKTVRLIVLATTTPATTTPASTTEATTEEYGLEPGFDVPVINVTVQEGDTAVLPCFVDHLGGLKVAWTDQRTILLTLDEQRIIDDPRFSIERPYTRDWNLHIRNVDYSDMGQYSCLINTQPTMKSKPVRLIVLATTTPATTTAATTEATTSTTKAVPTTGVVDLEPVFDIPQTINMEVQKGDTAVLLCALDHLGKHKVTWKLNDWKELTIDERLVNGDPRISLKRPSTRDWNLHIRQVRYRDSGVYTCQIDTIPIKYIKAIYLNVLDQVENIEGIALSPVEIMVNWQVPAMDDPINNYTVFFTETYNRSKSEVTLPPHVTRYTMTDLIPDTSYEIYVKASTYRAEVKSDVIRVRTPEYIPTAPKRVKATALSSEQILVSWKPAIEEYPSLIKGHTIHYGTVMNGSYGLSYVGETRVDVNDVNVKKYVLDGLEPGVTYYIKVSAYTVRGGGFYSRQVEVELSENSNSTSSTSSTSSPDIGGNSTSSPTSTPSSPEVYVCSDEGVADQSCKDLQMFFGSKKQMCKRFFHECCALCSQKKVCKREKHVVADGKVHSCSDLVTRFGKNTACTLFTRECCLTCKE